MKNSPSRRNRDPKFLNGVCPHANVHRCVDRFLRHWMTLCQSFVLITVEEYEAIFFTRKKGARGTRTQLAYL